jgi:hypothetical protein
LNDFYIRFEVDPGYDLIIPDMFTYIAKKYRGLSSLWIKTKDTTCTLKGDDADELSRHLIPIFSHCPQLTSYSQEFTSLSETILNEMDKCGIRLQEMKLCLDTMAMTSQCQAFASSKQYL